MNNNLLKVKPFILSSLRPFKIYVTSLTVVALGWAIMINLQPFIIKKIIDQTFIATTSNDFRILTQWMIFYFIAALFHIFLFRFYDWSIIKWRPLLKKHIALNLTQRSLQHSHSLYQKNFSGEFLQQYEKELWEEIGPEMDASYRMQKLGRNTMLLNFIISQAARNEKVRDALSGMLVNEIPKKELASPLFYLRMLLPF